MKRMGIFKKTSIAALAIIAMVVGVTVGTTKSNAADPFFQDTQTVSLTVQGSLTATINIISVDDVDNPTTIETYNSHITMELEITGEGAVSVWDQNGNLLFTYDKTTPGTEIIPVEFDLIGNPGTYIITASILASDGIASDQVTIIYKSIPIPPVPPTPGPGGDEGGVPGAPGAGYWFINGYAVPLKGLFNIGAVLVFLAVTLWVIFFIKRRRRNDEADKATAQAK